MTTAHPASLTDDDVRLLDNPAWYALTGPHARFAQVHGSVRRYDPDVSIFLGVPDEPDERTWRDLAALVGPNAVVPVSGAGVVVPDDWEPVSQGVGVQMIDVAVDARPFPEAVPLGAADADEMADLVARTQPGPWRPRTWELGGYLGVRREGRLVAMAGQRLHPPGWTEISAVCTDPDHRGQGLAGRLVRAVAHGIRSRGDRVLLHTAATNADAIRLYTTLGFVLRRETSFAAYRSPGAAAAPPFTSTRSP